MTHFDFSPQAISALASADVARALVEDVGAGDLTAALIDPQRRAQARVLVRESAVLCGTAWASAAVLALAHSSTMSSVLLEDVYVAASPVFVHHAPRTPWRACRPPRALCM